MNTIQEGNNDEKSCPYLGSLQDPLVSYYFPNQQNYCQHIKKPKPINLNYQEEFCLSIKHKECIVVRNQIKNQLPIELLGEEPKTKPLTLKKQNRWIFIPVFFVFALVIALFFLFSSGNFDWEPPSVTYQRQQSLLLSNESVATLTPDNIDLLFLIPTPKATTSPPATQILSAQNTPTQGPKFSTPVGVSQKYLVHQVILGESVNYLASIYHTSEESIIEINNLIVGIPIQENQILIIQPGASNQEAYDKLEAIFIQIDTSLKDIANLYSTTIEKLIDLNDLDPLFSVPAGRWLIVPLTSE
jgi:hypothetical protein